MNNDERVNNLIGKAMSTSSEEEAINAIRMARKKNGGKTWTPGSGGKEIVYKEKVVYRDRPQSKFNETLKETERMAEQLLLKKLQRAYNELNDDYRKLSNEYGKLQGRFNYNMLHTPSRDDLHNLRVSRRKWILWGWFNILMYCYGFGLTFGIIPS